MRGYSHANGNRLNGTKAQDRGYFTPPRTALPARLTSNTALQAADQTLQGHGDIGGSGRLVRQLHPVTAIQGIEDETTVGRLAATVFDERADTEGVHYHGPNGADAPSRL